MWQDALQCPWHCDIDPQVTTDKSQSTWINTQHLSTEVHVHIINYLRMGKMTSVFLSSRLWTHLLTTFRIYLSFIGSLGQFHGNANRKQEETLFLAPTGAQGVTMLDCLHGISTLKLEPKILFSSDRSSRNANVHPVQTCLELPIFIF